LNGDRARAAAIAALKDRPLDFPLKGVLPGAGPVSLNGIAAMGWSLLRGDLTMPVATLRRSAIERNSRWMRDFVERNGLAIAPHGKTTLAPQLFDLQARDGAWGITVSNVQQVALCRAFGFDRILIANQIVGRAEISYLIDELERAPEAKIFFLVDSEEGVARVAAAAGGRAVAKRLGLLLEVGVAGGRTGARTLDAAMKVARAVKAAGLSLRGIEGFEGILKTTADVDGFLDTIVKVAVACEREDLFAADGAVILSAGGTTFYDRVAARLASADLRREVKVVTRSGCYLTHDSVVYAHSFAEMRARDDQGRLPAGDLEPALNVWTHVQSRPEPGLAILTMGRRDVGFDAGLPVPIYWYREGLHAAPVEIEPGCKVTALNDQHAYLACPPESPLAVGDLVGFGISHPCTTFDKWQVLFVIDDEYRVVDAVKTFF
jgi:D-serine dehydratase